MNPTLPKGWLKRFLGGFAAQEAGHVEVFNDQGVELGQEVQALRQSTEAQAKLIGQLQHPLRMATQSQSAMGKRIQRLADDWPDLHARYFTAAGDQDRAEGKKTRTRRRAKRRKA